MKKKGLLLGVAMIMALSACGKGGEKTTQSPPTSQEEVTTTEATTEATTEEVKKPVVEYAPYYDTILQDLCKMVQEETFEDYFMSGESEAVMGLYNLYMMDQEHFLDNVGYGVEDLSGDGTPELVLGSMQGGQYGTDICSLYTCKEEGSVFLQEASNRTGLRYLGDGEFIYYGSGGAIYNFYGIYTIEEAGNFVCKDYYFTSDVNGDYDLIGVYQNKEGKDEVAKSKLTELTMDDYSQAQFALMEQTQNISLISLNEYIANGASLSKGNSQKSEQGDTGTDGKEPLVKAYWGYDYSPRKEVVEHIQDKSEYSASLYFEPESEIYNVSLVRLNFVDAGEDGALTFTEEVVLTDDVITTKQCVLYVVELAGTIPNYGIRYEDRDGKVYRLAIEESGMDGSLLLTPYHVQ